MSHHHDFRRVYVVSAPSGAGKTTLNRRLVETFPQVELSVSHTARKPRKGEVEGKDYFFVNEEQFRAMIDRGEMLEWALVHGFYYGTSKNQLVEIEKRGHFALLEIDVQGWHLAAEKLKKSTSIFILPPSIGVMWQRLESRGTDDLETRLRRLRTAKDEIEGAFGYDFFIVNDDLSTAFDELVSIVVDKKPGRMKKEAGQALCAKLLEEYDQSGLVESLNRKLRE